MSVMEKLYCRIATRQRSEILRYKIKLVTDDADDKERDFILQYNLATGAISIYEKPVPNSGFTAGYFLKSSLVPKYGKFTDETSYYSMADFAIGATINIFGRNFSIVGADLAVYHYMKSRPEKFGNEVIESVKHHLQNCGLLDEAGNVVSRTQLIADQ